MIHHLHVCVTLEIVLVGPDLRNIPIVPYLQRHTKMQTTNLSLF